MTQLNTPYPATTYLTGFLRRGAADPGDPGRPRRSRPCLRAVLARRPRRASSPPLARPRAAQPAPRGAPRAARRRVATSTPSTRSCASSRAATPASRLRIVRTARSLPEGPRFAAIDAREAGDGTDCAWAVRRRSGLDRPREHLASLYLDDLADVVRDGVAPDFELSRYGERLAARRADLRSACGEALDEPPRSSTSCCSTSWPRELVARHAPGRGRPDRAVPRQRLRRVPHRPRAAPAPRRRCASSSAAATSTPSCASSPTRALFDYVDFVTLDDGERPLLALLEHLRERARRRAARAPCVRDAGRRVAPASTRRPSTTSRMARGRHARPTRPAARSLPLAVRDAQPDAPAVVRRALEQAHGRARLLLEEVHLLRRHARLHRALRPGAGATLLVDRIEALIAETGADRLSLRRRGRAARGAARRWRRAARARGRAITWWGNIRFEKTFTPELAGLLAALGLRRGHAAASRSPPTGCSRCMKKGVTVEQVARVTRAFTDAGVMVHAYLMYGFPTRDRAGDRRRLERVRQLFAEGCIQSAFWHRFAAHRAQPDAARPEAFGVRILDGRRPARSRPTTSPTRIRRGADHERFARGLRARDLQLHARTRPRPGRAPLVPRRAAPADHRPARPHRPRDRGPQRRSRAARRAPGVAGRAGGASRGQARPGDHRAGAQGRSCPCRPASEPGWRSCWRRQARRAGEPGRTRAAGSWLRPSPAARRPSSASRAARPGARSRRWASSRSPEGADRNEPSNRAAPARHLARGWEAIPVGRVEAGLAGCVYRRRRAAKSRPPSSTRSWCSASSIASACAMIAGTLVFSDGCRSLPCSTSSTIRIWTPPASAPRARKRARRRRGRPPAACTRRWPRASRRPADRAPR